MVMIYYDEISDFIVGGGALRLWVLGRYACGSLCY